VAKSRSILMARDKTAMHNDRMALVALVRPLADAIGGRAELHMVVLLHRPTNRGAPWHERCTHGG